MFEQSQPAWFVNRGFKSHCRICGCWKVQGYHWMPIDSDGPTGTHSEMMYAEFCSPSDNLEFLEWCLEKKLESR
jgi:hypothetical protein